MSRGPIRPAEVVAFVRAVLTDRGQRRKWMLGLTAVLVTVFFLAAVPLAAWLEQHPWLFVLCWLFCAWLTLTVLLLAVFDMLMVAREGRRQRGELRRRIFGGKDDRE